MPIVGLSNFASASDGDGADGRKMPPYGPGGIYHEKQIGSLCAIHCVNNLLQGPVFTEFEFRRVAAELDRAEASLLGGQDMDYGNARLDGFFNVQVVQAVLEGAGYSLQTWTKKVDAQMDTAKETGFILNKREHWFAIRHIGQEWFDLNSCIKTPVHYEDRDVRYHIWDAVKEGYSVFCVRGNYPKCALEEDGKKLVEAVQGCGRPGQGYSKFAGAGQSLGGGSSASAAPAPAASDAAALRAARLARFGGAGGASPPADSAAPSASPAAASSPTSSPAAAPVSSLAAAVTAATAPAAAAAGAMPGLERLLDMGFPRDKAQAALRDAKGNVEAAAELLLMAS